ncbi:hypothetical protein TIFTF001_041577 [Ficus carica]|uniref:Uncharacterized protein n=1 Tax=Ficus carica TaxID=3494 RepID=A0AA87Z824_FICCA|nr:hypothetical protein TIFTF001_041577 [Ficus carica]
MFTNNNVHDKSKTKFKAGRPNHSMALRHVVLAERKLTTYVYAVDKYGSGLRKVGRYRRDGGVAGNGRMRKREGWRRRPRENKREGTGRIRERVRRRQGGQRHCWWAGKGDSG